MKFRRFVVVSLISLVLLGSLDSYGGVVARAAAPLPRWEPAACMFPLPDGQREGRTVECGYVVVPEVHGKPDGATMRLAVARFYSSTTATAPDPTLYLAGGPGQAGLRAGVLRTLVPIFTVGRQFVVFDQRGTGNSEPSLSCPEVTEQDRRDSGRLLSAQERAESGIAAVDACRDRLAQSTNLAAFSTTESAADVNDIRTALGYDRVNLLGVSYGTRLALTVQRDFPQIVRSVILDSVVPPTVDQYAQYTPSFDRALRLLFAQCAADALCKRQYPAFAADFSQVVQRLNRQPVTVSVTDRDTSAKRDAVITGDRLVSFIHDVLYIGGASGTIPALISQLKNGRTDQLALLLGVFSSQDVGVGMAYAVRCNEYVPFSSAESVTGATLGVLPEVVAARLPGELAIFRLCEKWHVRPVDPRDGQPVVSNLPALILASANDPTTPPAFGQAAAVTLSQSVYVETPGIGHIVLTNGGQCAAGIAQRFLDDPATKPDTSCVASLGIVFA